MALNAAQKTNLSVTWILGGLATTTVFTRLYVRFFQQRSPGWDDYAMILSWVGKPATVEARTRCNQTTKSNNDRK